MTNAELDAVLLATFLEPVRRCAEYRPAFGQGRSSGLVVAEFQELYGSDPFYTWLGLDAPVVYAAHKAAGGLTSIYRQIGVGVERLFRAILAAVMNLSPEGMSWSYTYDKGRGAQGTHTLDARILLAELGDDAASRVRDWIDAVIAELGTRGQFARDSEGVVFEIRQGYKSADSKRQNADLRFGLNAYRSGLLPVFAIFSSQVSEPVVRRYRADGMLVLIGSRSENPIESTFAFAQEVVGYDLARFFERNSDAIRAEIAEIVRRLLSAS
jgi:hypothetical protein